jgi:hypothetical protein
MSRVLSKMGAALFLVALTAPVMVSAQQAPAAGPLRVFLDCAACNAELAQTEISYVDWAMDPADADLRVIAREAAPRDGRQGYALDFTGLGEHQGRADTLTYYAAEAETPEATGEGLRQMVALGLMRYLANTPLANRVQIRLPPPPAGTIMTIAQSRDPWNFWNFSVSGSVST